jgi:hypothetical protein
VVSLSYTITPTLISIECVQRDVKVGSIPYSKEDRWEKKFLRGGVIDSS